MNTLFCAVLWCWGSPHLAAAWDPLSELLGLDSPHLACAWVRRNTPCDRRLALPGVCVTPDSGAVSGAEHSPTPQQPVSPHSFPRQPPKIPSPFFTQQKCRYWLRV